MQHVCSGDHHHNSQHRRLRVSHDKIIGGLTAGGVKG
jgi:hypothetical protein